MGFKVWWALPALAMAMPLASWSPPVAAQSARPVAEARGHRLKQVGTEVSMVLKGRLDVAADGRVQSHSIDDRDQVPAQVLAYLDHRIDGWRVAWDEGVGTPEATSLSFSVRLVATPDGDAHRLRIASTRLGGMPGDPAARLRSSAPLKPPAYPRAAERARAAGTVYVLLRVDSVGGVEDAFIEQVNLEVLAYEHVLEELRRELADAVLAVVPEWKFDVPSVGLDAQRSHHAVRVPVTFALKGEEVPYGSWSTYVPGPRRYAEWADYGVDGDGVDGSGNSAPQLVGSGPRLVRDEVPEA